jgi:predicted DNA-binding protein
MGKSRKPPKPKDQHRSSFMVRLPESYRERLTRLVGRTKRKMTAEVQLALDKHFRDEKID